MSKSKYAIGYTKYSCLLILIYYIQAHNFTCIAGFRKIRITYLGFYVSIRICTHFLSIDNWCGSDLSNFMVNVPNYHEL